MADFMVMCDQDPCESEQVRQFSQLKNTDCTVLLDTKVAKANFIVGIAKEKRISKENNWGFYQREKIYLLH